jgi:hypothetical protein
MLVSDGYTAILNGSPGDLEEQMLYALQVNRLPDHDLQN